MKPCTKVRHLTKREAKTALNDLKSAKDARKKPVRVYFCEECNSYHLTSISLALYKLSAPKDTKRVRDLEQEMSYLKSLLAQKDLIILEKQEECFKDKQRLRNKEADIEGLKLQNTHQKQHIAQLQKEPLEAKYFRKSKLYKDKLTHRHRVEDMFFEGRPTLTKQWIRFHKLHPFKQEKNGTDGQGEGVVD